MTQSLVPLKNGGVALKQQCALICGELLGDFAVFNGPLPLCEIIEIYRFRPFCETDAFVCAEVRKKQITLRAKDDLIYDHRFIAYNTDNFMPFLSNRRNESIINSLGSLLICLLSKNNDLPNRWNPLGHQQNWLSLAKVKLKNVPISSVTRDIIDGCFSKRNQETAMIRFLETKKGHSFVDDASLDPPYFIDVQAFIKYIDFSQVELEKQQLSVSNHQPRQLIPIHLKQMNRDNYQELIEE